MRDQAWLEKELQILLRKYFSDVVISNPIEIHFGREAKFRFGSIKLVSTKKAGRVKNLKTLLEIRGAPKKSLITITSMFANEDIPVDVVRYTICHELCHYAHGFSSTNKRMFKHPHHGGVVNLELKRRGAEELIPSFKEWLKQYRGKILAGRVNLLNFPI